MRRHTDTSTAPTRGGPVKTGIITSVDRDGEALAAGDDATVRITKEHGSSVTAIVPQPTAGDQRLPRVGQRGYYISASSGTRVLLGVAGTDHSGYSETRRVDHPHSDAYVEFDDTGAFTVVTDDGTEVTVDSETVTIDGTEITVDDGFTVVTDDGTEVTVDSGTVTIDGGTTPVVTDVETTTSDGYVTSVTPVTDDTIQV